MRAAGAGATNEVDRRLAPAGGAGAAMQACDGGLQKRRVGATGMRRTRAQGRGGMCVVPALRATRLGLACFPGYAKGRAMRRARGGRHARPSGRQGRGEGALRKGCLAAGPSAPLDECFMNPTHCQGVRHAMMRDDARFRGAGGAAAAPQNRCLQQARPAQTRSGGGLEPESEEGGTGQSKC
jgi:hypothetical protein